MLHRLLGTKYAYAIVATCIVVMFLPCAIILTCFGIFITPVSQYFGVPRVAFSAVFSVLCIAMTVVLPFIGKFYKTHDTRLVLSASVIICAISYGAMSAAQEMWHFYLCAVGLGIGVPALMFLCVPALINDWFDQRVGTFMGLCFAFTGIGGTVFNPIGSAIISSGPEGWRACYLIFALVMLVGTLPFTLFVVREKPQDLGLTPLTFSSTDEKNIEVAETSSTDISADDAMKYPEFYMVAAFYALITFNQQISQYFPSYAATFAETAPAIAAATGLLAGTTMLGQAIGKVLLGALSDISVKLACFVGIFSGIVGLLMLGIKLPVLPLLLAGTFLFGIAYALTTVGSPLLVRTVFGKKDSTLIYSRIAGVSSFVSACALIIWSLIVDGSAHGFLVLFGIGIVLMSSCLALALTALKRADKRA